MSPSNSSEKGNQPSNRLIDESSPYLLQHAHNPVNWYPWGDEALNLAKTEDKPIIVSIGYSACHWCHVMEKECFESQEVADLMNREFVCIKVDREERPDVDQIYIEAVQAMGIQGGWPLNVFLMPSQKPFYGGTYFPKPTWLQLLGQVVMSFKQKRKVLEEAAHVFAKDLAVSETGKYGISSQTEPVFNQELSVTWLEEIYQRFSRNFDREKGGMAGAPKFPMPPNWLFLLRYFAVTKNKDALEQAQLTLNEMAYGGIYDQIGGGFARYSVDAHWFAPHFEKMLYDNGQLVSLYAEAFTLTQDPLYEQVIRETIAFVERELMGEEGGFYAALDADSEGEEGKFYVWTQQEFSHALGETSERMQAYYNVTAHGNWEHNHNILFKNLSAQDFVRKHQLSATEFAKQVKRAKKKLLAVRSQRIRPGLDDKIITSWNGIMLRGLVDAFSALGDRKILERARRHATFLKNCLMTDQGTLWHTYQQGKARIPGFLEDYAFVIDGFLGLYQVTLDEQWLYKADALVHHCLQHFYDVEEGYFFYTDDQSALIARKKELFDNVMPSSNSMMAKNLYYLGILLDRQAYNETARDMVFNMINLIRSQPGYLSNWASLCTFLVKPTAEIVVVGPDAEKVCQQLSAHYFPNKILVGTKTESDLPLLQGRIMVNEKTTIYVCYNKTCQLPVHAVEEAIVLLQKSQ